MKTIFLTSCEGYINSQLISFFLEKGYTVATLGVNPEFKDNPNYVFSGLNINENPDDVKSFIFKANPDVFIHTAFTVNADLTAMVSDGTVRLSAMVDSWLFAFLAEQDIQRVICLCTSLIYGVRKGRAPAMENDVLEPYNNYTTMKYNTEMAMHRAVKSFNRKEAFVSLRVSPIYSTDMVENLLDFVYDKNFESYVKYPTDSYSFSVCHINNLLDVILNLTNKKNVAALELMDRELIAINVCDLEPPTVDELIMFLKQVYKETMAIIFSGLNTKVSMAKNLLSKKEKRINTNYMSLTIATSNHRINVSALKEIAPVRWNIKKEPN